MPERLGDYRILREVGRGGMGIVYEAVQESLGRHVALKVLSQHRQFGAVQLLRFEREAKAAALLHHTNIVPVFGVGEHEGVHYYAMQYIEGQSLDTVLAEIIKIRRHAWCTDGDEPAEAKSASLAEGLLYARAARPANADRDEAIGCHRGRARPADAASRRRRWRAARAGLRTRLVDVDDPGKLRVALFSQRGAAGHAGGRGAGLCASARACSIETSSRPTCCWTCGERSG